MPERGPSVRVGDVVTACPLGHITLRMPLWAVGESRCWHKRCGLPFVEYICTASPGEAPEPTFADVVRERERPYVDKVERAKRRIDPAARAVMEIASSLQTEVDMSRTRHYVGGDQNHPGCDSGEVIAQTVGYREGLRTLADGIAKRIELAATVDAAELRELIEPYLEHEDGEVEGYAVIPRTDITPFGCPDHLYHRAASEINREHPDEARYGSGGA
jgi:hypothetical protein